jgi:hypothetical protein
MPAFTKQNYIMVAKVLSGTRPEPGSPAHDQWERDCIAFLNHFRHDNPAFDTERFIQACRK